MKRVQIPAGTELSFYELNTNTVVWRKMRVDIIDDNNIIRIEQEPLYTYYRNRLGSDRWIDVLCDIISDKLGLTSFYAYANRSHPD